MTFAVVENWVEAPLRRFVDDARVLLALVLHPSGQVLAQSGFTRAVDVMSACALAAAIHASAGELGRMMEGRPFGGLHHAGKERQIFLAPVHAPRATYLVLAVFDRESSLGLVTLYFGELSAGISAAAPVPEEPKPVLAAQFERELDRNLAALFGRA